MMANNGTTIVLIERGRERGETKAEPRNDKSSECVNGCETRSLHLKHTHTHTRQTQHNFLFVSVSHSFAPFLATWMSCVVFAWNDFLFFLLSSRQLFQARNFYVIAKSMSVFTIKISDSFSRTPKC